MKLDSKILQKALYDMKEGKTETGEKIPYLRVTELSGVYNIGRFVDGTVEPTPRSWWRIHQAFPDEVPEPSYIDGERMYKNVSMYASGGENNQAGGNMTLNSGEKLAPGWQYLIEMAKKVGEEELLQEFIQIAHERMATK